jgi:hypothetical protein
MVRSSPYQKSVQLLSSDKYIHTQNNIKPNHFRQRRGETFGLGFQKGYVAIFLVNQSRYLAICTTGDFFLRNKQNVYVLSIFLHASSRAEVEYNCLTPFG